MSRLILIFALLVSAWPLAAYSAFNNSCLKVLSFGPAFQETQNTTLRDLKNFNRHRIQRVKFAEVDDLLSRFENDPHYYESWLSDFRLRAAQGNYRSEELIAASVKAGGRGPRLYEAIKKKNNLGARVSWLPALLVGDQQSSRLAERKHMGTTVALIQTISPIPLPLPNFSSMKYDLILPHEIADLDHAIVSTHDALEKPAGFSRRNIIVLAGQYMFWKPLEAYVWDRIRGHYQPGTPLNLWQQFMIETFEKEPERRKFLLAYARDADNLDVINQLSEELSPYEKSIAEKYGPDGLFAELISSRGQQYSLRVFQHVLKAGLIFGYLGYHMLHGDDGEGRLINGRFQNGAPGTSVDLDKDSEECTEDEIQDLSTEIKLGNGWSPFKEGFLNEKPNFLAPTQSDKSACDPFNVVGEAYLNQRKLHPKMGDNDGDFSAWEVRHNKDLLQQYREIIREQFNNLKTGCAEKYFKVQCHHYREWSKADGQ